MCCGIKSHLKLIWAKRRPTKLAHSISDSNAHRTKEKRHNLSMDHIYLPIIFKGAHHDLFFVLRKKRKSIANASHLQPEDHVQMPQDRRK